MNRLNIGQTILKLRKENKITQEQLAAMVGVTAGAVSKWETGNSTPDISLLAPLARALKTSLDILLSFHQELSEEEASCIKKELTDLFLHEGYMTGETKCQEYLAEYPNSNSLKYSIAGLIQIYSMISEDRSDEFLKNKLQYSLSLFQQVVEARDPKYTQAALFCIASIHLMLENFEESEKVLKELPQSQINPMTLYQTVLLKQGKIAEAAKICCSLLLQEINQSILTLTTLSKIAKEKQEYDCAFLYLETADKLENTFKTGLHSAAYSICRLHIELKQYDKAAKWFKEYIQGLLSQGYDYQGNPFFEILELELNPEGQKIIRRNLLQSLLDEEEFKLLSGLPDYDNAIRELKVAIS